MEPEKLMESFADLYRTYGYRHFRMSKFEKYELYAGYKDFLVSDRVITFTDTDGELLALKPDVTLSIVRGTAYEKGNKESSRSQRGVVLAQVHALRHEGRKDALQGAGGADRHPW